MFLQRCAVRQVRTGKGCAFIQAMAWPLESDLPSIAEMEELPLEEGSGGSLTIGECLTDWDPI